MKFRVGDKVKFLNEKGGGVISKVDDQGIVYVKDVDGFDIPVTAGEIVWADSIDETGNREKKAGPEPGKQNKAPAVKVEKADASRERIVCLGFRPVQQSRIANSDIQMHLINDSGYHLLYSIHYKEMDGYNYLKMGMLEPDTKVQVKALAQSEITKWSEIRVQILFSGKGRYETISPVDYAMDTARKRFYTQNTYGPNDYFEDQALIVPVIPNSNVYEEVIKDQEALRRVMEEKESDMENKVFKSPKPSKEIIEVDLHIHQLVDDYSNLSNAEMVGIQIDSFRKELKNAINLRKASKIVFIHGVGNGTLKYELRKELEHKYASLKFQDASFKEYGFGATMVYLK